MQVVYSYSPSELSVFPGQLMDVFIEDLSSQRPMQQEPGGGVDKP
jgi:hypothetical protein